jgi:hypothetical protein
VRYQVSGHVTDEAGTPIADAYVAVDYHRGGGSYSNPPSQCLPINDFCWLKTLTDGSGVYTAEFDAAPDLRYPGNMGYVYSFRAGFEANVQLLPTGATSVVRELRLRRTRTLAAGESTSVFADTDSSLCSDLEDLWALQSRCEVVRIAADAAGTLLVEARPANDGGSVPVIYWATTGDYAGLPVRTAPGAVSIPVRGGTYQIFIGMPAGAAPQRFEVSTELR